ncbi:type II toxin-antitoxin system HicB family antitoxin [Chryseolinea soli]|uniref:Type II toxin-antitoxin system HicB family antitoxin n=1 Tax=Chryseolinea soli TaxID=2321403 RepID=A0A385SWY0_9BACT|nr:type II toxin-antitoxin system HicB family antitoxin [Chryseolinea soli]AYB34821.1 type II toxin-antitoxin system HicB family antitoxin [Chryseolinea soli]
MRKLRVIISKGPDDYGAWIEKFPGVYGAGETVAEVKKNLKEGLKLYVKHNEVADWVKNKDYELIYKYDGQSFLNYFKGIFTNAALERISGINQRQINHYATGRKKPRPEQLKKLETGIHKLASELMAVEL